MLVIIASNVILLNRIVECRFMVSVGGLKSSYYFNIIILSEVNLPDPTTIRPLQPIKADEVVKHGSNGISKGDY